MRSGVVFFLYAIVIFVSCFIIVSLKRLPNEFGKVAKTVTFIENSDSISQEMSFPQTEALRQDSPSRPILGDETEQSPIIHKTEEARTIPPVFTQVKKEKKVVPTQKVQKDVPCLPRKFKKMYP